MQKMCTHVCKYKSETTSGTRVGMMETDKGEFK
jgi:hypothetical protein